MDPVVCSGEEDHVLIAFSLQEAVEKFLTDSKHSFECFLLDWTFKTNTHGLLLGSIGPVGLVVHKHGPAMRFLPAIFFLASKEDEPAQHMAVRLYFKLAEKLGFRISHGIFDCSVFHGVSSFTSEHYPHVEVRRCLQHVPWFFGLGEWNLVVSSALSRAFQKIIIYRHFST